MQPRRHEDTKKTGFLFRAFVGAAAPALAACGRSAPQTDLRPIAGQNVLLITIDGEVAANDAALAPLLDDLRAAVRPTLVIVTGDHGEALGEHGEESHGLFAYESTLRIPLIIAELPASRSLASADERQGEVSPVPARHIDILPTLLEAVGQRVPPERPGRTLLPASERRDPSAPRPSYFEAMGAMLNRGWAAHRRAGRSRQVHRSSDSRAIRPWRRPRRASESRRPLAGARSHGER